MADESLVEEKVQIATQRGPFSLRLPATFRALAYRDYRLLWFGQLFSSLSEWMEQVLRPILILEMTGSAVHLGLISAVRLVPQLGVGLLAGAVADRFDRRRILLLAQSSTTAIAFITAALVISGQITVWQLYATTIAAGITMAFNQPARQSFIPNLVPREMLANAVALNSVAFNMTRILGPSAAGLLIVPFGIGGVFLLKGFLMFAVVALTAMIATRFDQNTSHHETSLLGSLGEGVSYAIKDRFIFAMVALTMGLFVFGMPYQQVFVPLIAEDVLDIGPAGLGLMLAAMGAGALVGALAIATVGSFHQRGLFLIGGASIFGLSLVAFAVSAWIPLLVVPFLAVALSGMLRMTYMSTSNAFLLEMSPPNMHGRVMSFLSLDRGLVSLGAILAGVLAAVAGPQWGLIIMGTLCIVMPLLVAVVFPQLRRVD